MKVIEFLKVIGCVSLNINDVNGNSYFIRNNVDGVDSVPSTICNMKVLKILNVKDDYLDILIGW